VVDVVSAADWGSETESLEILIQLREKAYYRTILSAGRPSGEGTVDVKGVARLLLDTAGVTVEDVSLYA